MNTNKSKLSIAVILGIVLVLFLGIAPSLANALFASNYYLPLVYRAKNTPTPTFTPTPTATRTPVPQPIVNPGFEQGNTGWVFQPSYSSVVTSAQAHTGAYSAGLGNGTNNRQAAISQQFAVPYNNYDLQYWWLVNSNEFCDQRYDYMTIYVNGNKFTEYKLCRDLNGPWSKQFVNLINYRGQTIVFRMEFKSDSNISTYFYVDDFAFVP